MRKNRSFFKKNPVVEITLNMLFNTHLKIKQAPVVRNMDNAIHRINHYPVDSAIGFCNVYPLDSGLSGPSCSKSG